jgi:hypothetical protein
VLPSSDASVLAELVTRMVKANEKRNVVIHGEWDIPLSDEIIARMLRALDVSEFPTAQATKLSRKGATSGNLQATEIEALAQELADLKSELIEFVRGCSFFATR